MTTASFRIALLAAMCSAFFAFGSAFGGVGPDVPVSDEGGEPRQAAGEGVTGQVTYADGTPAPEITVVARSLDVPSLPIPEIGIFTGPDGWYIWPLRPGTYELRPLTEEFDVEPGRTIVREGQLSRLDFVLVPGARR